ncbi:MAG: UDP-N-acetylmuramate dehydrogenase [Acidimicrobiia bacterium]
MTADLAVVADELEARLPGAVERNGSLAALTTYHLGGPATVLVRARRLADLIELAAVVQEHTPPVLVVGRGSNLLVADAGFSGVAVVLTGEFEQFDAVSAPSLGTVRVGAAVPLPKLARQLAAAGLGGLEFFVGIPGSVGGAVRMNAGGHGRETAEVLHTALVVDLGAGGTARALTVDELEFSYRRSSLGPLDVVVAADFRVFAAAPEECTDAIDEIVRWRREHQPGGSNAGSVFANPSGDSAGRLIDSLGLKGLRVGGAVVSEKHANFFQAEAGATPDDVHQLVFEVQRRVADATGVELRVELRMVGFPDPHVDRTGAGE